MNKDFFLDRHARELIRLQNERRSALHDPIAEERLREIAMRRMLVPFDEERLREAAVMREMLRPFDGMITESIALKNHLTSLVDLREMVNRKGFFGASALDDFKRRMAESAQSIIRPPGESVAFTNLIEKAQIDAAKVFSTAVLDFLPNRESLLSSVASLQSDWPSSSIATQSIEGMAGLMSLHNAVAARPFGDLETKAFQSLLGQWDSAKLSEHILSDWSARTNFYLEQGFDARLTEFPERAFDGALFQSGLLRSELFSPVYPLPSDYESEDDDLEDEERIVKQRMLDAYDILFNLETEIRDYLTEVMTDRFGPNWTKQRVPGDLREQWKEKRTTAVGKGEKEQPILAYADFTDYERIIIRRDNWKEVFESAFQNQMDIQVSFQRLYPIRICTMHARLITKEDFLLLTVEASRILKAIGKADDQ